MIVLFLLFVHSLYLNLKWIFLCPSKQNHKMNVFSFVYLPPLSLIKKKNQNGGCTHVVSWYGMTL